MVTEEYTKAKPVDVICQHSRDGSLTPLKVRVLDEDGVFQEYKIKGYREKSHQGTRTMPDGVYVTDKTFVFECNMGNCTQALELIRQVCRARRLDEDDTFMITKKLLENYRNALWIHKGIAGTAKAILNGEGKRQVKQWYMNFKQITKDDQKEAAVDSAIFHVCRTDWIIKAVDMVMDKVNAFCPYGELYHEILYLAYIVEEKITDNDILEKLDLERSTYYRRKREAIFLAGILLWDEAREKCFV